jgi:hypothetical protein
LSKDQPYSVLQQHQEDSCWGRLAQRMQQLLLLVVLLLLVLLAVLLLQHC